MQLTSDEISDLAVAMQGMVIWRGCMAGGKFDEHYDTPGYRLFSDEYEPFHIVVTRKEDNKVILYADSMPRSGRWSGTEADYKQLWKERDNHNDWVVRQAISEALPQAQPTALLTVKGDTTSAKVTWTKREVQVLCASVGVVVAFITAVVLTILV